jgi:hypothetical protein
MIFCPKCGAKNGQRTPNPVKCCRCWHMFHKQPIPNQGDPKEKMVLMPNGSVFDSIRRRKETEDSRRTLPPLDE